jgi:hypothetical protein
MFAVTTVIAELAESESHAEADLSCQVQTSGAAARSTRRDCDCLCASLALRVLRDNASSVNVTVRNNRCWRQTKSLANI